MRRVDWFPGPSGRVDGVAMTDFFFEWAVREQVRELERVDRMLERWGWFRRGGQASERPGWRFRLGAALVRMGRWLQGGCGKEGIEPSVLAPWR